MLTLLSQRWCNLLEGQGGTRTFWAVGERLPGAVTKFAEANDMTLPQLQKAFRPALLVWMS